MRYALLVTIAPIVKDLFVLVPQDIREMPSLVVSGANVKATVSVLITRHVLTTNALIPAVDNVEQVPNARLSDIWLFVHAQRALTEMHWCPAALRGATQ